MEQVNIGKRIDSQNKYIEKRGDHVEIKDRCINLQAVPNYVIKWV